MLDAFPGHIGDVQQTVDAAKIDEHTVIGQVLDDALDDGAFLQIFQQRFAFGARLGFHHGAARNHDVVTALIQFDDLEFEFLAFEIGRVAHRSHVYQRPGQKRADILDVDREATLDLAADQSLDDFARLVGFFQVLPDLGALGFFARQPGGAEAVFHRIERYLDRVADLYLEFTQTVEELFNGDDPLRLEPRVDDHRILLDVDDRAGHDGARTHFFVYKTLFK